MPSVPFGCEICWVGKKETADDEGARSLAGSSPTWLAHEAGGSECLKKRKKKN